MRWIYVLLSIQDEVDDGDGLSYCLHAMFPFQYRSPTYLVEVEFNGAKCVWT